MAEEWAVCGAMGEKGGRIVNKAVGQLLTDHSCLLWAHRVLTSSLKTVAKAGPVCPAGLFSKVRKLLSGVVPSRRQPMLGTTKGKQRQPASDDTL